MIMYPSASHHYHARTCDFHVNRIAYSKRGDTFSLMTLSEHCLKRYIDNCI